LWDIRFVNTPTTLKAFNKQFSQAFSHYSRIHSSMKKGTPNTRGEVPLGASRVNRHATGRSYFLGIGINEYQFPKSYPSLTNAVRDVEAIRKVLDENFIFDELKTLTNKEATQDGILIELLTLAKTLSDKDKLLVYYAGHGSKRRLQTGSGLTFWVPANADPKKPSTVLTNAQILEVIREIPARHILLISDSCYSGSFLKTRSSTIEINLSETRAKELEQGYSRFGLFSGRENQEVLDNFIDGHSPFASALLKALQEHHLPFINTSLLEEMIHHQVKDMAPGQGVISGNLNENIANTGQYIFWRRERANPRTGTGAPSSPHTSELNYQVTPLRASFHAADDFKERFRLLFKATQLRKLDTESTDLKQLIVEFLEFIEKEEKVLLNQKERKNTHPVFPSVQKIIPLITKKILQDMEDFLRKSCELMLHGLEIPVLQNRIVLRDLCRNKSESFDKLIADVDKFKAKSKNYYVDSPYIRSNTKAFAKSIKNEIENGAFDFLLHTNSYKLSNQINGQISELKGHLDSWLIISKNSETDEVIFMHQIDEVIIQLKILKGMLDIIYAKTFDWDFSLS
jgi:hypothetical protein